jgi:lipopolysaccharide/colanic/teichoic acid biosynthesis glycosyltransferase
MSGIEGVPQSFGLPPGAALVKRAFDLLVALPLAIILIIPIAVLVLIARIDTGQSGIFKQQRIGLFGRPFTIYKIRTMRPMVEIATNVTTTNDPRITPFGRFLRRAKIDEFPQLLNVLNGSMSFVGPRPDVAEVFRGLDASSLRVLTVRPGITGPSSVVFRNEELLLAAASDPEVYNSQVLFPEKIRINLAYIEHYSIQTDVRLMIQTIFSNRKA